MIKAGQAVRQQRQRSKTTKLTLVFTEDKMDHDHAESEGRRKTLTALDFAGDHPASRVNHLPGQKTEME